MQVACLHRAVPLACLSRTSFLSTLSAHHFSEANFRNWSSSLVPSYSVHNSGRRLSSRVDCSLWRHEVIIRASKLNVYAVEKEDGEEQEDNGDLEEVKLKIPVGPIRKCLDQTFSFRRVLGPSSVFVVVTLAKPLGIIFEAVRKRKKERVVVADLVQGSNAQRAFRVNQLFQGRDNNTRSRSGNVILNGDVRPGDISSEVLHIADGRRWEDTMTALKAPYVADGPLA
ncbi:hypothetical protein R1sor_025461 [Riccia sorocarpa]|uniref:Uncharacterized protein n=1 Tax=Riccia sorocarpa TaxID=122646 RepID=A0ABD3G8P9_9MARC